MKKHVVCLIIIALLVLTMGCSAPSASESSPAEQSPNASQEAVQALDVAEEAEQDMNEELMIITSSGILNGVIDSKYGKNGEMQEDGVPTLSIPLSIENAPEGTVCFAVYMDDPDAKPLAGYNWVHWMAVNITQPTIPENFSKDAGDGAVQGTSDYGTIGYGGPAPPDKDHTYVIVVYALDTNVALEDGFGKDAFEAAIDGHVLASATLEALYVK